MSGFNTKEKNNYGEYEITFYTVNHEEFEKVQNLCRELIGHNKPDTKQDGWISVKDKLPEKNGNYLVCLNNGEITTDIFDEEELFMGFWGYMTHWRPLPKAPESEENK